MKNLLYLFVSLLFLSACRSIEKLVEKGEYDEAIVLATKKLAGKKNKKTAHVKALEKAFRKITAQDMDYIARLDAANNPYNWKKVLQITDKIEHRQSRIRPFLPLISSENYEAEFKFVNTARLDNEARNGAAEFLYAEGLELMERARSTDSYILAREAYHSFGRIERYRPDFKNTYELMDECYNLGQVHILVDTRNVVLYNAGDELFFNNMFRLHSGHLDSEWNKYHFETDSTTRFDYSVMLTINDISISPEREIINNHLDEKKVKEGWEYVKGKKGQILTDSLGNKIKRDVLKKVRARVTEISREKAVFASVQMTLVDGRSGRILDDKSITHENVFADFAVHYTGDKRALCREHMDHLRAFPLAFPDDASMLLDTADKIRGELINSLRRINV